MTILSSDSPNKILVYKIMYNTLILNEETFHPQGNKHWLFYMCKIRHRYST